MRALLDVNVLIALLDANHSSHHAALTWFATHAGAGWASCPLTQNGCLRIMAHPRYTNTQPVHAISERLRDMTAQSIHEFWADDISLLDSSLIDTSRIYGPQPLTDVYLLALAVARGGRLVTFDRAIARLAVRGATVEHVTTL